MTDVDVQSHILSSNADTQNEVVQIADKLYTDEKYEQALKLYNDTLLYNPNSDVYVKMGNCYEAMENFVTATEFWEKAIEIDSLNTAAFIKLGNYYYKKNQMEKAISYWLSSLISTPEEPTSNLNLAVAYTFKEMPMQAFYYYEKYLKYAQDKTNKKYIEIDQKISKNKKLANDYIKLGIQYQANKDRVSALKCYKKAINYCPIFSKAYLNAGAIYYFDKNYEEAVKYWTKAEHLDPTYPKIISNLAVSYDFLQKFDYAYCYYTRYSTYIFDNSLELNKVNTRCRKLKPIINNNPYLITNHLERAKEAFSNCDYFTALNEFKNYIILFPEEQVTYGDLLKKVDMYLHPESSVIKSCLGKGKELMAKGKLRLAKDYFARVLVLAEVGTIEYNNAKGKFLTCLQNG